MLKLRPIVIRALSLSAAAGLVCLAPSLAAAAGRTAPARLVASPVDRVVFQVDVPAPLFSASSLDGYQRIRIDGFGNTGNAAEPPVPTRTFLVAIPPDARYTVTARVLASQSLGQRKLEPYPTTVGIYDEDMGPLPGENVVMDAGVYRAWTQPALAAPQEPVYIRHQRALPIRVNPVSYDPVSGDLSVVTRVEISVQLSGTVPGAADGALARPEAKDWDDMFKRLFVNPQQAAVWRTPQTRRALDSAPAALRVVPGAVKLSVRETAMHKVKASTVIAQGFPAGQPLSNLHLLQRNYNETTFNGTSSDVAFTVIEDAAGSAGIFDGNDVLVFYGRRLRDDNTQGDTLEQYSQYNVYWLEPAAGTVMTTRTPGAGFVTADTTSASFSATLHFETDAAVRTQPPAGTTDIYALNDGYNAGPVDMPFNLTALKAGTNGTLSCELIGSTYNAPRTVKLSLVNGNGEKLLDGAYSIPNKIRRLYSGVFPSSDFTVGTNRFRLDRPNTSRPYVEVQLNYVEFAGQFLYRARGNTLAFNTASLAGDTTVTVTGFTSTTGLALFDITNPLAPVRMTLNPGSLPAVPGGFALSFRENIPSRRDFIAVPVSKMVEIPAADVAADQPSAIIGSAAEGGVDVLVVSYALFIPQMRQWVSYRRAQGYRVFMVDVEDVYDEFNGGIPSPQAVFRFTRHFFENGGAGALVVVGDGSEDHKRVDPGSGPNFVPAYGRIDAVPSIAQDEIVAVDKRYVKMPAPSGTVDAYPDLVYGRIPVGSVGELQLVLEKTFKYEAPTASDFWRKRMIIVSDDTYSSGQSSFGQFNQFCDQGLIEAGFETSQETCAQIIENALPAGYDVRRFFLRSYTSSFYTPGGCANALAAVSFTRQNVTELLMNELNQGATLVTIQSHMNRSLITHESLLSTYSSSLLGGTTGRDHLRMDNRDKPWVIFGLGCHFSEYGVPREQDSQTVSNNSPNGDAFAEQLLFQNDRGAVGTYGSAGFEYLQPNAIMMETMTRVWFYEAPYDTMVNQTRGEWIFGDLMYLTEAQLAGTQRDPVERYVILGDPLLRIDAGPPSFSVTVNGNPFGDGDIVSAGGEGDTIQVVAVVTDENAVRDFKLSIDGADATSGLTITPLVDAALPRARQYQVSFRHKLRPESYDIVLRAYQSPDTLAGQYHIAAEFTLKVESSITVSVNGRQVSNGAPVPARGDYRVDLAFPVFIPENQIQLSMDNDVITDAVLTHPAPDDSLKWIATFSRTLKGGRHVLHVVAGTITLNFDLVVSETPGLRNVINYPNPFRGEGTSIVYMNDVEILDGTIDIYTVSGKRVRSLPIPVTARFPGQNAVFWDGRDGAGEALANGTYLYVINIEQTVGSSTTRGKMTRIQ